MAKTRKPVTIALGVLVALLLLVVTGLGVLYVKAGQYGMNVLLRRGMTTWSPTGPDDPRLSAGMRVALRPPVPSARPGALQWRTAAPGFEVAELPVLADGREVDRILLSRIDPSRFRFRVLSRPAGDRELGDWMAATGAALVVNASYYAENGQPATPVLSDGRPLGPAEYHATHGAFVAGPAGVGLRDLSGSTWEQAFTGAQNALVSYPMLIGTDGRSRVDGTGWDWLANRTFLGQDAQGRIVLGTTQDAFFSLPRLADFLRDAPLGLRLALNLDGGPIACQGVRLGAVSRDFCGRWETHDENGQVEVLGSLVGSRRDALPLVLAVYPSVGG